MLVSLTAPKLAAKHFKVREVNVLAIIVDTECLCVCVRGGGGADASSNAQLPDILVFLTNPKLAAISKIQGV
jgi:hypothetical protein